MKCKCTVGLLLVLCMQQVGADAGDHYLLPKMGVMNLDLDDAKPLYSLGLMLGYGLQSRLSAEAELNYGFIGGAYRRTRPAGEERGHYRVLTLGAYGVYRYPLANTFYVKMKLGGLQERVSRQGRQDRKQAIDAGLAGGIGAGAVLGARTTAELELTVIDQDILFFSAGLHYRF